MSTVTRALVTGGNGFIGSALCAELRRQGVPVRALVLPGTDTQDIAALGVEVVAADISRPLESVLFDGISHVFHLAAIALDWGPAALFQRVNVDGTRHVLEAAAAAGVGHVLHMSSLAVHPYSGHAHGDEDTPRGWDINAYTRTKNAAEDVVQAFRDRMMVTIIRPGVVPYGPGDRLSLPGILAALDKGVYRHVGGGTMRVCLSYVGNLATGMVQAATRRGESGEAFVLADEVVTWRAFIEAVANAFDKPVPRGTVPFRVAWVLAILCEWAWRLLPLRGVPPLTRYRVSLFRGDLVFSPAKAQRAFGYAPAVGLDAGLARTRDWLRAKGLA